MEKPAIVRPAMVPVVRVLRLRRRRTNVPWIYSLYHVDPKPRRNRVREPREVLEEEEIMAPGDVWDGSDGSDGSEDWEEREEGESRGAGVRPALTGGDGGNVERSAFLAAEEGGYVEWGWRFFGPAATGGRGGAGGCGDFEDRAS